jgi:ComF family protein
MHLPDLLLDLLYPKRSLTGAEGAWVTQEELSDFRLFPLMLSTDALRKRGIADVDHVVAAGKYDSSPLFQRAIRSFKYGRIDELGAVLAGLMVRSLPGLLPDLRAEGAAAPVLCPVPLHWTRRFQRGFNQSEILARCIAKRQKWPMKPLLRRIRATGHQAHRGRDARLHALDEAFRYSGPKPPPARVLLVDDLFTTGSTLQACAGALKAAGVARVEAIVVAYG